MGRSGASCGGGLCHDHGMPKSKTFRITLLREGAMSAIPIPFDPAEVFGKVRAPVKVTLNGYTFRSTIAKMGGEIFIPLRTSNREAAGVQGTETLPVTLELDEEKRKVKAAYRPGQSAQSRAAGMGAVAGDELHPSARIRRGGGRGEKAGDAAAAHREGGEGQRDPRGEEAQAMKARRGFTLPELLVALLILAIVLTTT